MQNLANFLSTTIFVSVPESIIWVCIVFIMIKRYDLLDRYRWKENIKWILLPSISTAIVVNIFRFVIESKITMFFMGQLVLYVLIMYSLKQSSNIDEKLPYLQALIYTFIASVIMGLIETTYIPMLLHINRLQLQDVLNSRMLVILYSIPARVFQILLITTMLVRYNSLVGNLSIDNIFKDKVLTMVSLIFVGVISLVMFIAIFMIYDLGLLQHYSILIQSLVAVMAVTIPTCLLFMYFIPINYLLNNIIKIQKSKEKMFDDHI